MKILIVDDDPIAGEISQAYLEAGGYETILADNAGTARELLAAATDIALVVSDHHMPGMSGIDLYAALAEAGSKIPFILLSGDDPEGLRGLAPSLPEVLAKDEDLGSALLAATERLTGKGRG